jgi:hypothetical protein
MALSREEPGSNLVPERYRRGFYYQALSPATTTAISPLSRKKISRKIIENEQILVRFFAPIAIYL